MRRLQWPVKRVVSTTRVSPPSADRIAHPLADVLRKMLAAHAYDSRVVDHLDEDDAQGDTTLNVNLRRQRLFKGVDREGGVAATI